MQSSFRYDHPQTEVKAAIERLEQELPAAKPRHISPEHQAQLIRIANTSADFYKQTMGGLISDMQPIFKAVPKRRDRRQHIGLLAYSRAMGDQTLPRAITFTAGFYSVGVPPEFIGLGRTLKQLSQADMDLLHTEYHNISADFEAAGRFLNPHNLDKLAGQNQAWQDVRDDIAAAEEILGITFGPQTEAEKKHQELSTKLLAVPDLDLAEQTQLITDMGILRKSLG